MNTYTTLNTSDSTQLSKLFWHHLKWKVSLTVANALFFTILSFKTQSTHLIIQVLKGFLARRNFKVLSALS